MDVIVSLRRCMFRRNFLLLCVISITVLFSLKMYGERQGLYRVTNNWLGPRAGYQSVVGVVSAETSSHSRAGQRHFQGYPVKLTDGEDDVSDNLVAGGAANKESEQGVVAHDIGVLFHADKKDQVKNKKKAIKSKKKNVRKPPKRKTIPVYDVCENCCYSYTTIARGIVKMYPSEKLIEKGCQQRLPDAMIFGVKKGGTTTLRDFISYHPDVAFTQKELKFFTSRTEFQKGLEYYKSQMIYSTRTQVSMEKTPEYCHYPKVPYLINETLPNAKLIMIMRDPIERAVSDFVHMQVTISKNCPNLTSNSECYNSSGYFIDDTFEKSVIDSEGEVLTSNQLISKGVYVEDIKRYLKYFNRDRILPLDGERFISDPYPVVKKVEKFLQIRDHFARDHFYFDVQKGFFCLSQPIANNCMRLAKGRPHPDIKEETLAKLRKYYKPYNKALNELMGVDFHWSS